MINGFHSTIYRNQWQVFCFRMLERRILTSRKYNNNNNNNNNNNKVKKVKMSLCLTKHEAMKTYCGSGGIAPRILDLGT
jgi:hypothetical protein